ncbi:hypothetical protein QR680_018634 [Steinernema hermaphroditum]|uniref:C-type lectin domain-containing protein n=1 Tax=Steinernema hermaphroditum TaxID=289476 RepID=A0AA39HKX1_9BILA|nr:hypothetical protein QR680_018634 [Steinernema hermaphroditum]
MRVLVLLGLLVPAFFAESSCPPGAIPSVNGDKCFHLVTYSASFKTAQELCANFGGHLASVHNKWDEYVLITSSGYVRLWLGGHDANNNGTWTWTDGSPFGYSHWGHGEPSNESGKNCLLFDGISLAKSWNYRTPIYDSVHVYDILLYFHDCAGDYYNEHDALYHHYYRNPHVYNILLYYHDCGNYYNQNDALYYRNPNYYNQNDALYYRNPYDYTSTNHRLLSSRCSVLWTDYCKSLNGHLASIHNSAVEAIAVGYQEGWNPLWIGGRIGQEGRLVWSDGSRVDYQRWLRGASQKPTNGTCVTVTVDLFSGEQGWFNYNCNDKCTALCEVPLGSWGKTTIETTVPAETSTFPSQSTTVAQTSTASPSTASETTKSTSTIFPSTPIETTATTAPPCPSGFKCSGKYAYVHSGFPKTWNEAENYCQSLHGHLASIHNDQVEEIAVNYQYGSEPLWIGGQIGQGGDFSWSDGSSVHYVKWILGEPVTPERGTCITVTVDVNSGQKGWGNYACDATFPLLCEVPLEDAVNMTVPPTPPATTTPITTIQTTSLPSTAFPCPSGSKCYGNYAYSHFTIRSTWTAAETYCQTLNGHLASIPNGDVEKIVFSFQRNKETLWIGGRIDQDGSLSWSDGSSVRYIDWLSGAPQIPKRGTCLSIASINSTSGWINFDCSDEFTAVCEIPLNASSTTVSQSTSAPNSSSMAPSTTVSKSTEASAPTTTSKAPTSASTAQPSTTVATTTTSSPKTTTPSSSVPPTATQPTSSHCPTGTKCYGNYTYIKYPVKSSWKSAEAYCKALHGHLASIHNDELEKIAFSFQQDDEALWVGGTIGVDASLTWSDQSPFDYSKWLPKALDGLLDGTCVAVTTMDGQKGWFNFICVDRFAAICEVPLHKWRPTSAAPSSTSSSQSTTVSASTQVATTTASSTTSTTVGQSSTTTVSTTSTQGSAITDLPCPSGFKCYGDFAYSYIEYSLTWKQAEASCQALSGHLASIHNRDVEKIAFSFQEGLVGVWIGGKVANNGSVYWSDGSPMDYQNWLPGALHGTYEDTCVVINIIYGVDTSEKGWNNLYCGDGLPAICEIPLSTFTTTSVLPSTTTASSTTTSTTTTSVSTATSTSSPSTTTISPTSSEAELSTSTTLPPSGPCPSDSICFGNYAYTYSNQMASWNDAESYCQSRGGHLASVHNMHVEKIVQSFDQGTVWIGGKIGGSGVVSWSDGSPANYEHWFPGSQEFFMTGTCVTVVHDSTNDHCGWYNYDCTLKFPAVSQQCHIFLHVKKLYHLVRPKSYNVIVDCSATRKLHLATMRTLLLVAAFTCLSLADPCPPGAFQSLHGSKCFHVIRMSYDFESAEQLCANFGGHLASVHNRWDNAALMTSYEIGQYWLGGQDRHNNDTWAWTDGTAFNYNNWASDGTTHQSANNCLLCDSMTRLWEATDCAKQASFICETAADVLPTGSPCHQMSPEEML